MNRYISISEKSVSLPKYRTSFTTQHSKFIHSSWLVKEDLDRPVTLNGINYTIFGLWDIIGSRYYIMLKPVEGGAFYLAESKEVSQALGYRRMRNLVTGEEHKWDFYGKKALTSIGAQEETVVVERTPDNDEEFEGEWAENNEEDTDFIDPLVKALQDDITDDGDMANNQ